VLVCYDFHYGILYEYKDIMFTIEPKLF
jgi:hypothetical protein